MKIVVLMSGTSLDGIDAALLDISRSGGKLRLKLLAFETYPFPKNLREKLLDLSEGNETTALISHLDFFLGELFAEAVFKIAAKTKVSIGKIDLIGSHGQTVWHSSAKIPEGRYQIRSTSQIGDPSVIAVRTGVTTVGDFRPADIAAGGEGAPIVPYFHHALVKKNGKSRLIINIGGISNVTYLPLSERARILAFDTGPGNMLIDGLVQVMTDGKEKMDLNGRLAAKGKIHLPLLNELMSHPFIKKKPPKSTGREAFGLPMIDHILERSRPYQISLEDLMATATAFTSSSIYMNCEKFILSKGLVDEIVVGGGGVRNRTLIGLLKRAFSPVPLIQFEELGLDSKAIEAMAFALFAHDSFFGIPNNLPSVTGAKRAVVMGKICPGNNYKKLMGRFS
jgi:anhydro-N-acetylmuramic acid kinase